MFFFLKWSKKYPFSHLSLLHIRWMCFAFCEHCPLWLMGSLRQHNCVMSKTSGHLPFMTKKKKSFSGSIIPSLLPILKLFLLFTFKKARTETSFQFVFSPLTFFPFFILFFPAPCFRVSAGGGGDSWVGTAALSAARWRTSQGQRERERGSRGWMGVSSAASLH